MPNHRFTFTQQYQPSPVSFWVHEQLDAEVWSNATQFQPPLPRPIPGKGYVQCVVEVDEQELTFSSIQELEHVISILSNKLLPTTTQLAHSRSESYGPNRHWLSRLPVKSKSWKARQNLVKRLRAALNEHPQAIIPDTQK